MKKPLYLLAATILLLSCGERKQPPDSAIKWNPGDVKGKVKSTITTTYQPIVSDKDSSSLDQLVETDVILQVYNTYGELSESRWYDKDSTLTQQILFKYDVDRLLVESRYIDYQEDTKQVDSLLLLLTYNSSKKPIKEETYNHGEILHRIETEYNDNNDVAMYKSYQKDTLTGETVFEYVYNDDGRKAEEKIYNNGKLMHTMSWVYDKQGRTTAVTTKDGEVSFTESYRYDNKNRLIEETFTPNDNSVKRITVYQYDENDNMVQHIQKTEDGNILKCYEYTYDKRGNWIRSVEHVGTSYTICKRKVEYYQ